MNAIVGLCHFCEAHGPRPLFCTFTTDNECHTIEASKCTGLCNGCTSLGPGTVLVSRDNDGTVFCSRESVPNADLMAFLRQAALRSITCEVTWNKEGGVVYFSDPQGHVLSLMFHIKDTRARGLKRVFSIVVLMKDKLLLLNITPMLSEHMQRIATELQEKADMVYENEQRICSQRALRLKTGVNDFGTPRSLSLLTGDEDVYKKLHSHFTWMLRTGAVTYSETLYTSKDLLKKLTLKEKVGTIFEDDACSVPNEDDCIPLRELETLLTKSVFRILLYCTLVGVNIVVKSKHIPPATIIKTLSRFVPNVENHNVSHIRAGCSSERSSISDICCIEETNNNSFNCNWSGNLPTKCPTLMTKIENAMCNNKFNNAVLNQHVKSLQLEWLGIARTLKTATKSTGIKSEAVTKLKQVLGLRQEDEALVNFWSSFF